MRPLHLAVLVGLVCVGAGCFANSGGSTDGGGTSGTTDAGNGATSTSDGGTSEATDGGTSDATDGGATDATDGGTSDATDGGTVTTSCDTSDPLRAVLGVPFAPTDSPLGGGQASVAVGPQGQLFLQPGALEAEDGRVFEPAAPTTSAGAAAGRVGYDRLHDRVFYGATQPGSQAIAVMRRVAMGCAEQVATLSGYSQFDVLGVADDGTVFALAGVGAGSFDAYLGTSDGTVWTKKGSFYVGYYPNSSFRFFGAVAPSDATHLLVATSADGHQSAVRASTDGGATWNGIAGGDVISVTQPAAMAIDPANAGTIYLSNSSLNGASFFVSTDGGQTFAPVAQAPVGLPTVIEPQADGRLFVLVHASTTGDGLWMRAAGATAFTPVDAALPATEHGTNGGFFVVPGSPEKIFRSGETGLFVTADGGATWNRVDVAGLPGLATHALLTDPRDDRTFFALEPRGVGASGPDVIFHTTDRGASFTSVPTSGFASWYLVTGSGTLVSFGYGAGGSGVLRTTDLGATWTATTGLPDVTTDELPIEGMLQSGQFAPVAADASASIDYFAVGGDLYRSDDDAASWTKEATIAVSMDNGFGGTYELGAAFLVDPTTSKRVYLFQQQAPSHQPPATFLVSTDGGQTFAPGPAPSGTWQLSQDGRSPAIDASGRLYLTANGATGPMLEVLDPGAAAWAVRTSSQPNPLGSPALIVGNLAFDGLGVSSDGGLTWTPLPLTADAFAGLALLGEVHAHRANPKVLLDDGSSLGVATLP